MGDSADAFLGADPAPAATAAPVVPSSALDNFLGPDPAPPPLEQTAGGALQATGTIPARASADLAGLPVDTGKNVYDLGKVATGLAKGLEAGSRVPDNEKADENQRYAVTKGGLYHYDLYPQFDDDGEPAGDHPQEIFSKTAPDKSKPTRPHYESAVKAEDLPQVDTDTVVPGSSEFFKQLVRDHIDKQLIDLKENTLGNRMIQTTGEQGLFGAAGGGPAGLVAGGAAGAAQQAAAEAGLDPRDQVLLGYLTGDVVGRGVHTAATPEQPKPTPAPAPDAAETILNTPKGQTPGHGPVAAPAGSTFAGGGVTDEGAPVTPVDVTGGAGQAKQRIATPGENLAATAPAAEAPAGETPEARAARLAATNQPSDKVRQVAQTYAQNAGLDYHPPADQPKIDPALGKKIADAYEAMPHAPDDPAVKASYEALAKETLAQYQAIKDSGLKVEYIRPGQADPYADNPRGVIDDIRNNNHMWVYPTDSGFGSDGAVDVSDNPLLRDSGEVIDGKPAKVNDIFRVVHDYFGHAAEGNGFRASGEYNAWRQHAALYSPAAQGALASETLGQNAWVNFGPHGEANRTASAADTKYADQKTGLMPEHLWKSANPQTAFMKDLHSVSEPDPSNPAGRKLGGSGYEVSADPQDPKTIHIKTLNAEEGGKGHNLKAMQQIADLADRHGMKVVLDGKPLVKGEPSSADATTRFYQIHGFDGADEGATRTPGSGAGIDVREQQKPMSETARARVATKAANPMTSGQPYTMLSAERADLSPRENVARSIALERMLQQQGLPHIRTRGMYQEEGQPAAKGERSFAVQTRSAEERQRVQNLGALFRQDEVYHVDPDRRVWGVDPKVEGAQPVDKGKIRQSSKEDARAAGAWTRDNDGNHWTISKEEEAPTPKTAPAPLPQSGKSIFGPPAREGISQRAVTPAEQAERVAAMQRVGLDSVRTSAITGDTREAGTDFQTSKLKGEPAGEILNDTIEKEHEAVRSHAEQIAADTGGSQGMDQPALYDRGAKQEAPIRMWRDYLEEKMDQLYALAKAKAKGIPFKIDKFADILNNQQAQFMTSSEGTHLLAGVKAFANQLGLTAPNEHFNPATVEQAEAMRKFIGDAYNPRTQHLTNALKAALDDDVTKSAGSDIYAHGRAIRMQISKTLEEPDGVSKLERTKQANKLNVNRAVPQEDVPGYIRSLPVDQFGHYIDLLKDIGNSDAPGGREAAKSALNETRAHFANEYQAAGESTKGMWNQKKANQYLRDNELNMRQVFTPEEMQRFKDNDDVARAIAMDRSYPGSEAQKQNLLAKGASKMTGAAEVAGTHLGGVPGLIVGKAIGKAGEKLSNYMSEAQAKARITNLSDWKPPSEPKQKLGDLNPKQRGAIGAPIKRKPVTEVTPKPQDFMNDGDGTTRDTRGYGLHEKVIDQLLQMKSRPPWQRGNPTIEQAVMGEAAHLGKEKSERGEIIRDLASADPNDEATTWPAIERAHDYLDRYESSQNVRKLGDLLPGQRGAVGAQQMQRTAGMRNKQTSGPSVPRNLKSNLTDEEKAPLRAGSVKRMVDAFESLPAKTHELVAAALAGKAKKGWYRDSAEAIANVFGPDSNRFAALLAALSPQTSVQSNFHNAVRTFINWDKAGRPTDSYLAPSKSGEEKLLRSKSIEKIMGDSVQKQEGGKGYMLGWVPNSIRALTHPDPETLPQLSGPKVDSFMRNLRDNVHAVTLDAWMASFANIDPALLGGSLTKSGPGKSPTYLAYSAKVRQAASMLTHLTGEKWTPAEVQETVWSWAKTAYEHAQETKQKVRDVVRNGAITDDLIRSTPDFYQLFGSPEHAGFIANSRYGEAAQQLAGRKSESSDAAGTGQAGAAAEEALRPHLDRAAKRLDAVMKKRAAEKAAKDAREAELAADAKRTGTP